MSVDAFAVADEIGELLTHGRQFVETGLLRIPQRRPDHQIGHVKDAQNIGECRVTVQGAAYIRGSGCVAGKDTSSHDTSTLSRTANVSTSPKRLVSGQSAALARPAKPERQRCLTPGAPMLTMQPTA